jgi:hypothetical protein
MGLFLSGKDGAAAMGNLGIDLFKVEHPNVDFGTGAYLDTGFDIGKNGGKAAFTGFGVEWMLKEADPETKRDWKDTLRALTGAGVTLGTFKLRVGYDANDPKTAPEPAVATDAAPPAVAAGA